MMKAKAREEDDFKAKENEAKKNRMRKLRENKEYRAQENMKKRKLREDKEYRAQEIAMKRKLREDNEFKTKENEAKKKRMRKLREDKEYNAGEIIKKRKLREEDEFKAKENKAKKKRMRKLRENKEYRAKEKGARNANFYRDEELNNADRKKLIAAKMARYRLKKIYCKRRFTEDKIFEFECERFFKPYIIFDLRHTRFEKTALFCCTWMIQELKYCLEKAEILSENLFQVQMKAMRLRLPLQLTDDNDKRVDKEGSSLYTDIYARFGTVCAFVAALRKWGRRSLKILKLGADIIKFMFMWSNIDVHVHFTAAGGIEVFKELIKYLQGLNEAAESGVILEALIYVLNSV